MVVTTVSSVSYDHRWLGRASPQPVIPVVVHDSHEDVWRTGRGIGCSPPGERQHRVQREAEGGSHRWIGSSVNLVRGHAVGAASALPSVCCLSARLAAAYSCANARPRIPQPPAGCPATPRPRSQVRSSLRCAPGPLPPGLPVSTPRRPPFNSEMKFCRNGSYSPSMAHRRRTQPLRRYRR